MTTSGPREVVREDEFDSTAFWRWAWKSLYPYLGWICLGIGFLALLVGWYEVSGTAVVAKQLPYVVSAGLLGVGLISLGARFLMIQDLRKDSGRLDRLETMVLELHATLLARADAPDISHARLSLGKQPGPAETIGSAEEVHTGTLNGSSFLVLPGGQSFHRPDCPMLEGKDRATAVKQATAARRGLVPCPLCEPTSVGV